MRTRVNREAGASSRRSTSSTPPCAVDPVADDGPREIPAASPGSALRRPSQRFDARRGGPACAPMWLTSTISPPGLITRANSSSVRPGRAPRSSRRAPPTRRRRRRERRAAWRPSRSRPATPARPSPPRGPAARAQHGLGQVDADDARRAGEIGQFEAGADADVEDCAARPLRRPRPRPGGRAP